MKLLIGRIFSPEERAEERLKRRARGHLDALSGELGKFSWDSPFADHADPVCDILSELSFTLRRLLEIRRDTAYAKKHKIGVTAGSKKSIWNVLDAACHLQTIMFFSGGAPPADPVGMISLHSDEQHFGLDPREFFEHCENMLSVPLKPHFGLFSDLIPLSPTDEEGRPVLRPINGVRGGAEVYKDFYWNGFDKILPGHPDAANAKDANWVIGLNPSLQHDPIFQTVFSPKRTQTASPHLPASEPRRSQSIGS